MPQLQQAADRYRQKPQGCSTVAAPYRFIRLDYFQVPATKRSGKAQTDCRHQQLAVYLSLDGVGNQIGIVLLRTPTITAPNLRASGFPSLRLSPPVHQ
jgi:hypothetical protein